MMTTDLQASQHPPLPSRHADAHSANIELLQVQGLWRPPGGGEVAGPGGLGGVQLAVASQGFGAGPLSAAQQGIPRREARTGSHTQLFVPHSESHLLGAETRIQTSFEQG